MALTAPTASATVATAPIANAGVFASARRPNRTSRNIPPGTVAAGQLVVNDNQNATDAVDARRGGALCRRDGVHPLLPVPGSQRGAPVRPHGRPGLRARSAAR